MFVKSCRNNVFKESCSKERRKKSKRESNTQSTGVWGTSSNWHSHLKKQLFSGYKKKTRLKGWKHLTRLLYRVLHSTSKNQFTSDEIGNDALTNFHVFSVAWERKKSRLRSVKKEALVEENDKRRTWALVIFCLQLPLKPQRVAVLRWGT